MADVRLIDANALKKHLRNLVASGGHKYYRKGMDDTLHRHMPNIIDDQPTVDAAPVVHGRWCFMGLWEECSVCKHPISVDGERTNFCPNCGAKMDLEV